MPKSLRPRKKLSAQYGIFYMTAPSAVVAEELAHVLLEKRLVACVNILREGTSFYWWEGKIQHTSECILIAKSQPSLFDKIQQEVLKIHPYKCVPLVCWPLIAGNEPFLKWIEQETLISKPKVKGARGGADKNEKSFV